MKYNNWGGGLYEHLRSTRIFTLLVYKIFLRALEIMKKVAMALILMCLNVELE